MRSIEMKGFLSGTVAAIVVSSAMLALCSSLITDMIWETTPHWPADDMTNITKTLALTPHDPISIDGNAGFNGPNTTTGIVWGSGSESDPYVIPDWDINASNARGIYVKNADVHFSIRGCNIHDGIANENTGIYLENCTNGTIRDNYCSYNWYGVFLADSSCDNIIINNTCSHNRYDGIELFNLCDNNTIRNNTFISNLDGIHLESSRHNVVKDNVMIKNGVTVIGYLLSDFTSNDIDYSNTVNGRPVYYYKNQSGTAVPTNAGQIILANCTDFVIENHDLGYAHVSIEIAFSNNIAISNNTCSNNSYGILLWFSNNSTLNNNTIYNKEVSPSDWWYGIGLHYSDGNTICNNTVSGSIYGIGLHHSNDNKIVNNRYSNNSYGVFLSNSDSNEIAQNVIADNTYYGVLAFLSARNLIWNNTFIHNNGATDAYDPSHVQANEDGARNWWNTTDGRGNYWYDWTKPDLDMDGIVDIPYEIAGSTGARDHYPLTAAPQEPIPEFGLLPLVIASLMIMTAFARKLKRKEA